MFYLFTFLYILYICTFYTLRFTMYDFFFNFYIYISINLIIFSIFINMFVYIHIYILHFRFFL